MEKKCGNCHTKRMANNINVPHSSWPRAAVQPKTPGIAPGNAPTKVQMGETRFNGVNRQIHHGSQEGQQPGQGIREYSQIDRPAQGSQHSSSRSVTETHAARRQRTLCSPPHLAVHFVFHHFIQRSSSAGNQPDPQQGMHQPPRQRRHPGLLRPEVVAAPRRHHDQTGHAQLHQFAIVAQKRRCVLAKQNQGLGHRAHGRISVWLSYGFPYARTSSKSSKEGSPHAPPGYSRLVWVLPWLSKVKSKLRAYASPTGSPQRQPRQKSPADQKSIDATSPRLTICQPSIAEGSATRLQSSRRQPHRR